MLIKIYNQKIKSGKLKYDEKQVELIQKLKQYIHQKKVLQKLFTKAEYTGIYIYGSVGTGKTTIMDIFFKSCSIKNKKRIHLMHFLQNIHELINIAKNKNMLDPMEYVFKQYKNLKLLCIDEFEIYDVVNSILIRRLLIYLGKKKCIFIFTSNTKPENIYQNGLQRDKFLELINYINHNMEIFCLNGDIDYRKHHLLDENYIKHHKIFQVLSETEGQDFLQNRLLPIININKNITINSKKIHILNREIVIEVCDEIAIMNFEEFCIGNYASYDYKVICKNFKTIVLYKIPSPNLENLDAFRRFCILIDEIYESKNNFFAIKYFNYITFDASIISNKIPQIIRCFSRLHEMDKLL